MLLIDRDAIGILEVGLHHGMVVNDLFTPVFPVDVGRDVFHRPRTVEGIHGDKIFEAVGLKQF